MIQKVLFVRNPKIPISWNARHREQPSTAKTKRKGVGMTANEGHVNHNKHFHLCFMYGISHKVLTIYECLSQKIKSLLLLNCDL
jgi:hypothetical protein